MHFLHQISPLGWNDLPTFAGIVAGYVLYRLCMTKFLTQVAQLLKPKSPAKFVHRTFDMIHYLSSAILGSVALYNRPYGHCAFYARDCGEDFRQTELCTITGLEKMYFTLFAAYYLVDVAFLWTNSDGFVMVCHHFATISMIGLCVSLHMQAAGICVMLLHDFVDVPLYVGKICIYLRCKNAQDIALVTMAVLYTVLRMGNYPLIVYHVVRNALTGEVCSPRLYGVAVALLFVLLCCHIHWFTKIVNGVVKIARVGKAAITDTRSE